MTTTQKIIKYLAIALAIFLIVTIISAILMAVYSVASIFGIKNNNNINKDNLQVIDCQYDTINSMVNIDLDYSNLIIKRGPDFSIKTNNQNIYCTKEGNELEIEEKDKILLTGRKSKNLVIYIPDDFKFEKLEISTGAGTVNIENILAGRLNLELGAGETKISNIVADSADIETGMGEVTIESGIINNLNFDIGMGETTITAKLTGINKIEAGIGEVNLNLLGSIDDYQIYTNKGVGTMTVDGKKLLEKEIIGTGNNIINIDGGIGEISVDFVE